MPSAKIHNGDLFPILRHHTGGLTGEAGSLVRQIGEFRVQKEESSAVAFEVSVEVFSCPSKCLLRENFPVEMRHSGHRNCQRQEESHPLSHFPCFLLD